MGRLDGQVALITGGASGLGLAIVERFVREGARVVVLDRSAEHCQQLQDDMAGAVICVTGDVRSMTDNKAAVSAAVEKFGRLDCAVGNAGIWDYQKALVDLPEEKLESAFDEMFGVNVLGYLTLAKASLKPLAQSAGSVIFTVSNAGFLAGGGGVLYTATKHAVVGMIRQLAYELAPHVRVNGVAPGAIATSLKGLAALGQETRTFPGAAMAANAAGFVPIGRMPTPSEYSGAYVFFASREDNVPATGTVLNHDGGFGVRGIGAVPRAGDDLMDHLQD